MKFIDAAHEILKKAGKPLHYKEIASLAEEASLFETTGLTPEATMGARLYTDTLKNDSLFRRGDERGTFALKDLPASSIEQQVKNIQSRFRDDLRYQLLHMHPRKFEELIRMLLEQIGFEQAETTTYSNDKGVDVRGILRSNPLSVVKVAIQAKRWTKNVGSGVVRDLRGSLLLADAEQGLIITPSDFTSSATDGAHAPGMIPIQLINGDLLMDLLTQYNVGVKQEQYTVPILDREYWSDILDVEILDNPELTIIDYGDSKPKNPSSITFPVTIQATYKDKIYKAHLISLEGEVFWKEQKFTTPSGAAKAITVDWKSVNGWNFWHYEDPETGNLEKIGKLRIPN